MPVRVGEPLSLEDVVDGRPRRRGRARGRGARADPAPPATSSSAPSTSNETVYGVTTGFGSLANVRIEPAQADALQHGIVRSHATAVGRPLSREEARAMLLLRAHVLALGHSGVRVEVVERMVEMLNRDLVPVVPEQGSLGASGDLAPLANLALPLLGRGELLVDGEPVARRRGPRARRARAARAAREGGARARQRDPGDARGRDRSRPIARRAWPGRPTSSAAMSVEAALGSDRVFDERLIALRPHPGVVASAANLRRLLAGSAIVASHRDEHASRPGRVLAPVRAAGERRDARGARGSRLASSRSRPTRSRTTRSCCPTDDEILSGGNFHGQPVAVALDALAAALVPLASIAERRLYRLLDPARNNGLPAFLVARERR